MSRPPSEDAPTWTRLKANTITLDMNPMCYGRGCFSASAFRREYPDGRVSYFCAVCAARAQELEATEHG